MGELVNLNPHPCWNCGKPMDTCPRCRCLFTPIKVGFQLEHDSRPPKNCYFTIHFEDTLGEKILMCHRCQTMFMASYSQAYAEGELIHELELVIKELGSMVSWLDDYLTGLVAEKEAENEGR